jgi:hypothetical protein
MPKPSELQKLQQRYYRTLGTLERAKSNVRAVHMFLGSTASDDYQLDTATAVLAAQVRRKYEAMKKEILECRARNQEGID